MANRSSPPPSKPSISVEALQQRVDTLEKLVKDALDERNHWNALIRTWIGKTVVVRLIDGHVTNGTLQWVDRYTLCVGDPAFPVIVHKGAIAIIQCMTSSAEK